MAGEEAVGGVADTSGNEARECGEEAPRGAEEGERAEDGVGAEGEGFLQGVAVGDEDCGVELVGVEAVAGEDFGGEGVVLRGEAEAAVGVVAEEPADGELAEAAVAVVEEDVEVCAGFLLGLLVVRHGSLLY